ncbi:MAG: helix-turn-helix domain-containing protein [Caldilineaceae bacterium]|nr:helix-turn-helix domain-containing protein [Caldilineaceae bacterium]
MSDKSVIIDVDARPSDSPYVESVWRSRSERDGEFLSVAASNWEMVITELEGNIQLTVRGPETQSQPAHCPADGEWLGVIFRLGTYMPHLPTVDLVDAEVNLERAGDRSFWLHGAAWEFPTYENVDTFIEKLVREELLVHDPVVADALQNRSTNMSLRSVQLRFLHATGLTQGQVSQIERARLAVSLLQQGVSILDVVDLAGYADQPHLTRALKRFAGQTPAQILSPTLAKEMSYVSMTGLVE